MHAVADTTALVADGVITEDQAREIERRGRSVMVRLAVNSILVAGILAATGGLIAWLADALAVAAAGVAALGIGWALGRGGASMVSRAATLIGAGLLIGGGTVELLTNYPTWAGPVLLLGGAAVAAGVLWAGRPGFVPGALLLLGGAAHLMGLAQIIDLAGITGIPLARAWLYATAAIAAAGWWTDVRLVTALAIVPFAQMLETGTFYWRATYSFFSPETTLSILQMALAIGLCIWLARRSDARGQRHLGMFALMAFIVANLCALVGSLWGDVVGESLWGPGRIPDVSLGDDFEAQAAAREDFLAQALVISAEVYAVLWAVALAALIIWTAATARRGLFNAAMTFAAIHAYTQLFESFGHQALAYVIGGLAAIPLAWGLWRANQWIAAR